MNALKTKQYRNDLNWPVLGLIGTNVKSLLDVGCGTGVHAQYLTSKIPDLEVDGITISKPEADSAAQYCRKVWHHDAERGLPDECLEKGYDCVICSHILEHMAAPDLLLQGIRNVLSEKGSLIVAIPNLFFITSRLKILCGDFQYEEVGLWDETHLRWYTSSSLNMLLDSAGFTVEERAHSGYIPLGPIRKLLGKRSSQLDRAVVRLRPDLFAWQFVVKAKRHR
jgi:2-polyprenyl-3-methyl-5-hydroxy-6-metoxy-1,4-benzoquinol methylase